MRCWGAGERRALIILHMMGLQGQTVHKTAKNGQDKRHWGAGERRALIILPIMDKLSIKQLKNGQFPRDAGGRGEEGTDYPSHDGQTRTNCP